jgi:hypothetical protein
MTRNRVLLCLTTLSSLSLAILAACSDRAQDITVPVSSPRTVMSVTDPPDPSDPADPTYSSGAACNFSVTDPYPLKMTVSQRLQVYAYADYGCTITWTAEPSDVVTLTRNSSGVEIFAKKATSKVTIKGTIGATSKGFEMQIVNARVEVTPATATIPVNGTQQLVFRAYDHTGWEIGSSPDRQWSITSTNSAVAAINTSTGVVTGRSAGTAQIIASLAGGADTSTITVVANPVATVTVSPNSASLSPGMTMQLTATLTSSSGAVLSGRTVTWTSSSTNIATVSSSGVVTGVAAGSATITATAEGKSGTAALTVKELTCNDCHTGWVPLNPGGLPLN